MQRISITNPQNIIDGTAKKYYFKLRNTGGPKGDKGDKGDTGATGPQGPQGNAATVSVGSTTTLPVGYDATVTNTGSTYNAVLDFGIPQGPQGPQGAKGDKGDTGAQGETGPRGPQGERGSNATVYIGTTTTGEPGTQASVYNSGTESNAVLNFTIPRGDVGPSVPLVQETGYSTTKAMSQNATTEALNGKQNTLTAGSNITISGNTISAKDTTYTAGDNVQINGTVISATDTTYTAGANIQIQNGTISATDTTYTAGTGLTLTGTEFSADTDVLATKEDLEGYYTKPETDNLLAPKLEAEVVTELPTTGAEGKLYLTPKSHTTSTATGNPIEATVAEEAGKIESFQLDGDTFQQTYTGKNLFNKNDTGILDDVRVSTRDGKTYGSVGSHVSYFIKVEPSTTYALITGRTAYYAWYSAPSEDSYISGSGWSDNYYFTSPANAQYIRFDFTDGNIVQFVKGTSVGDYEPYVGGQPSPNPSYPQDINVVTGTQTISINGTNYSIDLGSIELCNLGTYQDYIWKDGKDWKVHKELGNVTLDSTYYNSRYGTNSYGLTQFLVELGVSDYYDTSGYVTMLSNSFTKQTTSFSNTQVQGFLPALDSKSHKLRAWIRISTTTADTTDQFKAWLNSNTPIFYYKLDTPTDTTITDTTLVAQLEAIRTAALQNGTNTITNSATGTNLAGDMEIGYYGFNPTNRYDKFIWLDLNNNYEQIGGE